MTEKLAFEEDAFKVLEKDFQEVINELIGDKTLDRFRNEYQKLHRALKKSHDSEKRLMTKCRDLSAEIVTNSAKVAQALKFSNDDQVTIQQLKQELEKAWKMVDVSSDKEIRARETIQSLKMEIAKLTKLVEQGAGLSMGQEHSVSVMLKMKEEVTRERDELLKDVANMREKLADTTSAQQQAESEHAEALLKVVELQQELQMKQNEIQRDIRRKDKVERELLTERKEVELKAQAIKNLEAQLQRIREEKTKMETSLREQKTIYEKALRDIDLLNLRVAKLYQDYQNQIDAAEILVNENQGKAAELKLKEEELVQQKQETVRVTKMRETTQRRLQATEESRAVIEGQKEILRSQISGLERLMDNMKKQNDNDRKALEDLVRERDVITKNYLKQINATQKQTNLVKLHQRSKRNLEQEIQNYKNEATKQRKIIYQLEKDRDRYISEASDLTQKVLQHVEELKIREMQIFDFKKKIAESETKLKQQQNLYEAVRSDRNLYSKNLLEAQDEISELKKKLKIFSHQIDQLKEEISTKETALVKVNLEHTRLEKEKETLKAELQKLKLQASESRNHLEQMEKEISKLQQVIRESDVEHKRQNKELVQVINERDILGTQLVRRNDELALLYEKIKIQQSTLDKGELQYRQRLDDLRILKLEIKKLRREKIILKKGISKAEELKREVYHTQRDLLSERTRCKAMEQELERPLNIHRWRKLEGADPNSYELIQKLHALQKRLIEKTGEVVAKEMLIQEKEKLYLELKCIMSRQPGPEVADQMRVFRESLKTKTRQMKRLASELNMYESQATDYKYEIERLARELQDIKKKYFLQKKKEQKAKDRERALENSGIQSVQPHRPGSQHMGGGYSATHQKSIA